MPQQNIKQIKGATQGSVLFLGTNGVVSESNSQLYWSNSNNSLGIGTSSTFTKLHIVSSTAGSGFTLQDSSQGLNKVLTSDVNGVGTWVTASVGGAGNGLSVVNNDIYLGGTLSQNTTISVGVNEFIVGDISGTNLFINSTIVDMAAVNGVYSSDIISEGYYTRVTAVDNNLGLGSTFEITADGSSNVPNNGTSSMIIIDQLTSKGVVYANDYSSNFTPESLVSKRYVDSVVVSSGLTATNGLTETNPNVIALGGTLSQITTINASGYDFIIGSVDNLIFTSSIFDVSSDMVIIDGGTGTTDIYADSGITLISTLGDINMSATAGNITTTGLKGLVYTSDYSLTFVTHSLITKGYLESNTFNGTGSSNYITRWITSTELGTGSIYDSGTAVGIGTQSDGSYMVNINGDVNILGTLFATSKSFEITHPMDSTKRLTYGSLEGPEYGVYFRGKLDNEHIINLPDYWVGLVDENSITVSLTPFGIYQNLYVEKVENNKVFVRSVSSSLTSCYYVVYAERKDIPKIIVEK